MSLSNESGCKANLAAAEHKERRGSCLHTIATYERGGVLHLFLYGIGLLYRRHMHDFAAKY